MTAQFASLVQSQDFAATIKVLDTAITGAQKEYDSSVFRLFSLLINRGFANQKLHLYRKAIKDYDAALQLLPTSAKALYRKGQVLHALKKTQEAEALWTQAAQLADPSAELDVLLDIHAALQGATADTPDGETASPTKPYMNGDAKAAVVPPEPKAALQAGKQTDSTSSGPAGSRDTASSTTPSGGTAAAATSGKKQAGGKGGSGFSFDKGAKAGTNKTASAAATATVSSDGDSSSSSAAAPPATPPQPIAVPAAATSAAATTPDLAAATDSSSGATDAAGSSSPPPTSTRRDRPKPQRPRASAANFRPSSHAANGVTGRPPASIPAGESAPELVGEHIDCTAPRAPPSEPMGASMAINIAIMQINAGKLTEAETLLDQVLSQTPRELSALVARGTSRALNHNLRGAVEDFTRAIEVEPRYSDSYKRRGQALSALGDNDGALADLQRALDTMPPAGAAADARALRAEILSERGLIYQKQRDFRRAAREFRASTDLDPSRPMTWNMLGLVLTSRGDIRDGVMAYDRALALDGTLREAWLNKGQALKEEGRVREAEAALLQAIGLQDKANPSTAPIRLLAQMRQGMGNHSGAIKILTKAIDSAATASGQGREDAIVECRYLRGICHHALGQLREAVRDYEGCVAAKEARSEEIASLQFVAWYLKEMAQYTWHALDKDVTGFCPDNELPALFKECWCKKGPPSQSLVSSYRLQAGIPPLSSPRSGAASPPPGPDAEALRSLTDVADRLGLLLQNHHQGFLPNVRQQRAAGYAAVELAQRVVELVAARRTGHQVWVNSEGASGQGGCSGRHEFGWRDALDIVVKWRQLAEPNDQVVWVDLLTRREFEQGFGSHTPMYSGQTKCVRYYMNFARALELYKKLVLAEGYAFDANNKRIPLGSDHKRDAVRSAKTAWDMYQVVGADSWVVVPIGSVADPLRELEGTRLTLVRVPGQPAAVEFSIRTPVTPPRWKLFDAELEAGWERIMEAMVQGDLPATSRAVLQFCYYWYNFMPLARGTAACGYTTLLAMFWAAGMPITATIPKDYQVDWEAILSQHPDAFIERLSAWLVPPQAKGQEAPLDVSPKVSFPPVTELPVAIDVLRTMRARLDALNGPNLPRVV